MLMSWNNQPLSDWEDHLSCCRSLSPQCNTSLGLHPLGSCWSWYRLGRTGQFSSHYTSGPCCWGPQSLRHSRMCDESHHHHYHHRSRKWAFLCLFGTSGSRYTLHASTVPAKFCNKLIRYEFRINWYNNLPCHQSFLPECRQRSAWISETNWNYSRGMCSTFWGAGSRLMWALVMIPNWPNPPSTA